MKRIVLFTVLAILASAMVFAGGSQEAAASAPAPAAAAAPAAKTPADTLRVVLNSEPSNVDPHNNTRLTSWAVQEELFDKLVTKDEKGNILPDVATKWEQIDDVTTRFYLRNDVYFHDGSKLTAEDVVYSLSRATKASGSRTFFNSIDGEKTKVVDEYTVDVVTKTPFAPILNYLAAARGAIIPKAYVEKVGAEYFGLNPIGSGPFKFVSWTAGSEIVLEKNENYWGEKPAYNKLQFRFITEAANRAIELETGNADISYSIVANDAARLKDVPSVKVVTGPAFNFVYMSFNMSDPVLKNQKLREALTAAVDVNSLVQAVYRGTASVANSYMSSSIAYQQAMPAKEFNVEKAKKLLAEAGYPNGLTLSIKLNEDTTFRTIAEIIQSMWAEIGVKATIETMEQATYLEQANAGKVQVAVASSNAVSGDPDNALMIWRSTAVNAIQPCDTHIDDLLNAGGKEFDASKRAAIYLELQQYLWDKCYGIPLAFPNVTYGTAASLEGFYCHPGSTPDLAKVRVYK